MEVLIILGMHRSGTSALARCLQEMGVSFIIPSIHDGYWDKHIEYYQINQLNDEILKSWKAPILDRHFLFTKFMEYKVRKFVDTNIPKDKLVGIKDPRMLLTFDYWAPNITKFKIIGIFRRPEEIASSLAIRDVYGKASFDQGLELWKTYNEGLLSIHNKHKFPILNFNESKENFGKHLESICCELDLPFSQEIFDSIFTETKKHHNSENIPEKYLSIYNSLLNISNSVHP